MAISAGMALLSAATAGGAYLTAFGLAASFYTHFAITFALGAASRLLSKNSSGGSIGRQGGYTITATGSVLDHQIIYGRTKVAGARIYDTATGNNNKEWHRVLAFAGHEIESFDEIYINDDLVTLDGSGNVTSPARYVGFVTIKKHLGSTSQLADADLVNAVTEWTSEHRLRGIAYLYVKLNFSSDVFPNGLPEISATIKGMKVYDPRSTLAVWSDNPALCLRDYLRASGFGVGEAAVNVDDAMVITAANICDETSTIAATTRYTCNGAFLTDTTPTDFLNGALTSMGGTLWYAQGKWRMKAAAWIASVLSLNEDDLRGGISVSTRHSRRDNFNKVNGTFRGAESNWQVTDFPPISNAAFVSADNGQEKAADLRLPFTDNSIEARRVARILLEGNRQQLTIKAPFGLRALAVQVGDVISMDNTRFGWTAKPFLVIGWSLAIVDGLELQVSLTLRETAETVFDEFDDGLVYERDNTELLSPFEVPALGLGATSRLQVFKEKVTNIVSLTVSSADPSRVDRVEIGFREVGGVDWVFAGSGDLGVFEISELKDGAFDFRARAINTFGIKGVWTEFSDFVVLGAAAAPADVTDFAASISNGNIHFEWTAISDLDLSYYQIRHSVATTGANWSNSTTYVAKIARPATSVTVPARAGSFMIRAFDKLGQSSASYATIVIPANALASYATTLSLTDSPTFSGTKVDCAVNVSNYLEITDPSVAPSEATYSFSTYIDATTPKLARVRIDAALLRVNEAGDTFDALGGSFDALTGNFDGLSGANDAADTDLDFYVSITQDDPAGSPTWTAYQRIVTSDLYGRAFRFQVKLKSTNNNVTPNITALTAYVEHN